MAKKGKGKGKRKGAADEVMSTSSSYDKGMDTDGGILAYVTPRNPQQYDEDVSLSGTSAVISPRENLAANPIRQSKSINLDFDNLTIHSKMSGIEHPERFPEDVTLENFVQAIQQGIFGVRGKRGGGKIPAILRKANNASAKEDTQTLQTPLAIWREMARSRRILRRNGSGSAQPVYGNV